MNVGPTATKKNVLEQLLDQGMVLVALDARIDGVEVPSHLGRDAQLRLNLSYRFGLPMTVDEWGILATLTFAGVPFNCRFPWRSVFLLVSHVSGQPYLFPDDIPPELLSQATAEAGIDAKIFSSAGAEMQPATPSRPKLQLVQPARDEEEDDGDTDDDALATRTARKETGGLQAKATAASDEGDSDEDVSPAPSKRDESAKGPRVGPALKRRPNRSHKTPTPARAGDTDDDADAQAPRGPQAVSQPARVRLSSTSSSPSADDKPRSGSHTDAGTQTPDDDEPPKSGPPRKGGHLRVVK